VSNPGHIKVAFIGVPGAGKSTVAQAVQVEMGSHSCITAVAPEYAREFITKNGQPEHIAIQQGILFKQMHREDTLSHGVDILFCDSPVFFCYTYALLGMDPKSTQQAKIVRNLYKWAVLDNLSRYDLLFYLPRQFEIVDDSVRSPGATEFIEQGMLGFLHAHKHLFSNYHEIVSEESDPQIILQDRVKQIKRIVNAHIKKSSS
jgi:nicotinamide riboside kinase